MTLPVRYLDLKGRRALVTGGSSGIGLGIAEAFLEQGMKVAIHYRSQEDAARALAGRFPGRAFPVRAELASEAGAVGLVRESVRLLGGLDQLVHSAGIWNDGPIDRIEAGRIEEIFRVNVFSAFYLVREALPGLRAGGPGNVILGPLIAGALPNRRVGEIDDCAHAALYLASQASGHLVGQDLCVSGGALLVVPRGQVVARST
jgi:3-oxoacyl-[acyl-carrier protein] reductase